MLTTRVAPSGIAPQPGLERVDRPRPVGEHVGMVPFRAGQDGDLRPVGVEVAGVLVGLDDERVALSPARGGRRSTGQSTPAAAPRRTPTDPRRPRRARGRASRRSCSCRGSRPRRPGSARRPRRRRPAATARPGSRPPAPRPARGCRGRPRSAPWSPRAVPVGGGVVTWPRRGALRSRSPAPSSAGVYGDGPPGSQPVTTAPARAARIAAALAPAPAAPTTWIRSPRPDRPGRPGRLEARPDPFGGRGHRSVRARGAPRCRSSSRASAAAALRRLLSARSPLHTWRWTATPTASATAT